jgi:hypothetical protein
LDAIPCNATTSKTIELSLMCISMCLQEAVESCKRRLELCTQFVVSCESCEAVVESLVDELSQCSVGDGSLPLVKTACEKLKVSL